MSDDTYGSGKYREIFAEIDIPNDWEYDPTWDPKVLAHDTYWGVPEDCDVGYLIEIRSNFVVLIEWDGTFESQKEFEDKDDIHDAIRNLIDKAGDTYTTGR